VSFQEEMGGRRKGKRQKKKFQKINITVFRYKTANYILITFIKNPVTFK